MFDMVEMLGHSNYDLRSSIVLTYTLDLTLYDGLIRRTLNRTGIWNQAIFCDLSCYVRDAQSHNSALYIGRHYSVTPIWQPGAFHPKVYMLLGPRHGRLLVGSGNASVGGLIRNAEVFGLFDSDGQKENAPHAAFSTVFTFVEELGVYACETVRRQIASARQMAPWLSSSTVEDGRKVVIGGPGRPQLLAQILKALPTKNVDHVLACSSSFDRNLSGMKTLATLSKTKPVCVVQPDHVQLDGEAVRKLGHSIDWRPFVDPYPIEKRQRKDVRAHAKIFIFQHGSTETCVFGSPNASAPALNSANTEIAVVLPQRSKGDIVRHLGLEASVKAKSIHKELTGKQWDSVLDERPESKFSCLLSAIAWVEPGYRLSMALGKPPKGSRLALSDRGLGQAKTNVLIERQDESFIASSAGTDELIRIGWISSQAGKVLSNAVAITWPTVGHQRKVGVGGGKATQALGAMQDGVVLGTVLFEFLDQFRDFEVIRVGTGKTTSSKKESGGGKGTVSAEQSAEFFYTDAKADAINGHHWTGDRIDLDILASLVQPLASVGSFTHTKDEDEWYDDSKLDEEGERRLIDAQKGKATGDERRPQNHTTSEKLEAAVKKLEHRLNRAATSIEDSLEHLRDLQSLAPNGVARQIWMTHIGAFLAGRTTESSDGEKFICLAPWCFADYVLRVCRALTGSKKMGGFLDKLAKSSWEGSDGQALGKGLAFLWSCSVWAAAYMVHYYSVGDGKRGFPESIAVASAELVAARFIQKVKAHCLSSDRTNLEQRFPAWALVPAQQLDQMTNRLNEVVSLITDLEISGKKNLLGYGVEMESMPAGTLVHNPKLGVTMLALDGSCRPYRLVDLSASSDEPAKFGAPVTPILFNGEPYQLFQRTDETSTLCVHLPQGAIYTS